MGIASGVEVMWPSTNGSIPAGWARDTSLDARFPKMVATSGTNPGATGGSASHNHSYDTTHVHTWGSHTHTGWGGLASHAADHVVGFNPATPTASSDGHTHAFSSDGGGTPPNTGAGGPANYDTLTVDPQNLAVIFIKSDGSPGGFPANALVYYNAAAPAGWARYANSASRFMKGAAAAGDGGGTAGTGNSHVHTSASHTHTEGTHTHPLTSGGSSTATGQQDDSIAGTNASATSHAHTYTSAAGGAATTTGATEGSAAGDSTPQWMKQNCIQNTGAAAQLLNAIAIWTGTIAAIPSGWVLCDGNNGTPNLSNGKYVMGTDSDGHIGTTGGATTHLHGGVAHSHSESAAHNHAQGAGASSSAGGTFNEPQNGRNGSADSCDAHTHTQSAATSANQTASSNNATPANSGTAANDPVFTGVAYIQQQKITSSGLWGFL